MKSNNEASMFSSLSKLRLWSTLWAKTSPHSLATATLVAAMGTACLFASLGIESVWAVERSQLWLPRNYYRHYDELHAAAIKAEKSSHCASVITGSLVEERSELHHPIFKITCRDRERKTFAFIVDGISLEILNPPPPPDPEVLARQKRQREFQALWETCYQQLDVRTRALKDRKGMASAMPTPEAEGVAVRFQVDFNSRADSGGILNYRGLCEFDEQSKRISIHARIGDEDRQASKQASKQASMQESTP